jgi:hypothetical protein
MKKSNEFILFLSLFTSLGYAGCPSGTAKVDCLTGVYKAGTGKYYVQNSLKITNNCPKSLNFRDATISFVLPVDSNGIWLQNPLPFQYPNLSITTHAIGPGFEKNLSFTFPKADMYWTPATKLGHGKSFEIIFGMNSQPDQLLKLNAADVSVCIKGAAPDKGSLKVKVVSPLSGTTPPKFTLQGLTPYEANWTTEQTITDIPVGQYNVIAENVTINDKQYIVTPSPTTVSVSKTGSVIPMLTLTYAQQTSPPATLNLSVTKPIGLDSSSVSLPSVTAIANNASTAIAATWDTTQSTTLSAGVTYSLSTNPNVLSYSSGLDFYDKCQPVFDLSNNQIFFASEGDSKTVNLSWQNCVKTSAVNVKVNLEGMDASKVQLTLIKESGDSETLAISKGLVTLKPGNYISIRASDISGYTSSVIPRTLNTNLLPSAITVKYTKSANSSGPCVLTPN